MAVNLKKEARAALAGVIRSELARLKSKGQKGDSIKRKIKIALLEEALERIEQQTK